jgi:hypothetical protein
MEYAWSGQTRVQPIVDGKRAGSKRLRFAQGKVLCDFIAKSHTTSHVSKPGHDALALRS